MAIVFEFKLLLASFSFAFVKNLEILNDFLSNLAKRSPRSVPRVSWDPPGTVLGPSWDCPGTPNLFMFSNIFRISVQKSKNFSKNFEKSKLI